MSDYELTDSDYDYDENEKILLKNATKRRDEESEEEVFNVHSSKENTDEDSFDDDIEDRDDGLPSSKAWGKSKRDYYNTDYVDPDFGGFDGKDGGRAEYEEQEARAIQERLLKEIDENDYILDSFKQVQSTVEEEKAEEKIEIDISGLSKREKLALFAKESPEFAGLVEDFEVKMEECDKKLLPILNLVEKKEIPNLSICKFIRIKYDLSMNYCTNIMYYLLLKSQRVPIQSHPVIKRIVEHRQLLNQLEKLSEKVLPQIDIVLEKLEKGEKLEFEEDKIERECFKSKSKSRKEKATKSEFYDEENDSLDAEEDAAVEVAEEEEEGEDDEGKFDFDDNVDSDSGDILFKKKEDEFIMDMEDDNEDKDNEDRRIGVGESEGDGSDTEVQRRSITYQIAKNKGLTPYRKKENRNPRVKYRNKFLKAKKRRKGQVREARSELQRYGGEISGIKIGISRSTKLK